MSSLITLKAEELELIPQIDGTCWFNSILTVLLYSEGLRNIIYNRVKHWSITDIQGDRFKQFIIYILKYNYSEPGKIRELFRKRFKTSSLLLSLIKSNPESMSEIIKIIKKQIQILKKLTSYAILMEKYYIFILQTSFLDIFFKNKNEYLSILFNDDKILFLNNNDLTIQPEVIFLFHNQLLFSKQLSNLLDEPTISKKEYPNKIEGINKEKLENKIILNGVTYKLEASMYNNFNTDLGGHLIAGITYDNKHYIYNGWTRPEKETKISKYYKHNKYACPLFEMDWMEKINTKEEFCFHRNDCKIIDPDQLELCFKFSKDNNLGILIYIKESDIKESLTSLKPNIRASDLQYNTRSISFLEKGFYDFNSKSIIELEEFLFNSSYFANQIDYYIFKEDFYFGKYKILYFILCKSRFDDDLVKFGMNTNQLYRLFLISIIKNFLNSSKKKLELLNLDDLSISYFLSIKKLTKLLKFIGYNEDQLKLDKNQLFRLLSIYIFDGIKEFTNKGGHFMKTIRILKSY